MTVAAALLLVSIATAAVADQFDVEAAKNPVEGVVSLLERLNAKITAESKAEAAAYDKFACFCKDQADEKLYSITKKTERIDLLSAEIKKLTADITDFNEQLDEATLKKTELEKESKAAKAQSFQDFQDYQQFHDDHTVALEELDRAIEAVKNAQDLTKGASLIQTLKSNLLIREYLAEAKDPDAKAYEGKGGAALENLIALKIKFTARLKGIESDEVDRKHKVAMKEQARQFEITALRNKITKCEDVIGKKSAQKSADEQEKDSLTADRADEQAFLDKLTEECEDKASKWDARSKRRMGEIAAIAEALGILKGAATSKYASAEKSLAAVQKAKPVAAPKKRLAAVQQRQQVTKGGAHKGKGHWVRTWVPDSFLQLSSHRRALSPQKRAIEALVRKATSLRSSSLYSLVMQLRDSPFDSVKKMVQNLIKKIDEEQKAEEEEIEACKNDILAATQSRASNQAKMEDEEATIIEDTSVADTTAKDIEALAVEITELYRSLDEATQLRTQEKAENEAAISDATEGKFSVSKAINVLKKFYEASFEGGLIQKRESSSRDPDDVDIGAPDATDFLGDDAAADPSQQGESEGIFGLLETVESDYQDAIDKVTGEETDATQTYDDFKSSTEAELDAKKTEKAKAEKKKKDAKEDLAEWTKQKGEAEHELSILNPRCLGLGASAEERKKRREEEKTALGDAITILETMAPADAPAPTEPEMFLEKRRAVKRG